MSREPHDCDVIDRQLSFQVFYGNENSCELKTWDVVSPLPMETMRYEAVLWLFDFTGRLKFKYLFSYEILEYKYSVSGGSKLRQKH